MNLQKRLLPILIFITISSYCLSQYSNLKIENDINNFHIGDDISKYKGLIIDPKSEENSCTAYMYNGPDENTYNYYGIKFSLIVLVFNQQNKLVKIRFSERYYENEENKILKNLSYLNSIFENKYGENTIIPFTRDGHTTGKTWKDSECELSVLKIDVETFGTWQLTVLLIGHKIQRELDIKNLKQNISTIDKIEGFGEYLFGKTYKEFDCEYMDCVKYPVNLFIGENLVESINLNFSSLGLYEIIIKFKTDNGILETLTSKYGEPYKEIESSPYQEPIYKYFWEGEKIKVKFYNENNSSRIIYTKIYKKSLNDL